MQPPRSLRICAWFITAIFASTNTWAGTIALADAPLVTGLSKSVAPNILFILDDSGSMDSDYMPDEVKNNDTKNCFKNFGYNTIYFNPSADYPPPLNSDGTQMANASVSAAYEDGFLQSGTAVDLAGYDSNPVYGNVTTGPATGSTFFASNPLTVGRSTRTITVTHTGAAIDGHVPSNGDTVVFTGLSGTKNGINLATLNNTPFTITYISSTSYSFTQGTRSTNAAPTNGGGSSVSARYTYSTIVSTTQTPHYWYYNYTASPTSPPSSCEDDTSYTQVGVNTLSATMQQKYANWYSFYRTRLLMMKTAAGRAFSTVTDDYRVGFTVISDKGTSTSWLDMGRFDSSHKSSWYSTLYDVDASSYTPLRAALSKAGRYYAGKLVTGDKDPVQYSCQQNFTILTTDGYWNVDIESPHNNPGRRGSPTAALTDAMTAGAEADNYGPFQMDNVTRVGDQDSGTDTPRPLRDDNAKSNTLADVAMYYYKTDLRPDGAGTGGLSDEGTNLDVTENNVPQTNTDSATYQHMVTFTLGLGVDGSLANTAATISDLTQGTTRWPDPIANTEGERIDDLWHAALNGRGRYLSAKNASAVEEALSDALKSINYQHGSASAAATSNLQPIEGDNTAFIAQYDTGYWIGDLQARSIDVATGAISSTNLWSGKEKLDTQVAASTDTRTIYTYNPGGTRNLKSFEPANLTSEKTAGYSNPAQLTQYTAGIWTTSQKSAATADKLINYLRGQRGNEDQARTPANDADLFRKRVNVLGDISSAAPVYVRKPVFSYVDDGYTGFLSSMSSRAGVVYVGANDGMLHAFDASTETSGSPSSTAGTELWSYIPKMVVPNLYRLADGEYAGNHRFFVDGPIVVGDAYSTASSSWRTILVGGLGHGGRGYYALDVTDPANPTALWEFSNATDADMGYSYGNPIITKRQSDGKWVVIFASGYNNHTSSGDGKGRLFVVDAFTGSVESEIITDNDVTDPNLSGIARISNYVEDGLKNNSTQYVYGGDLTGNLWRFDIDNESRVLLGTTTATPGAQPITVQPELARIRDGSGNWHRVVYFGTGRGLGPNDLSPSDASYGVEQAVYAVKDTGASLEVFSQPSKSGLVEQTLVADVTPRKIDPLEEVDWQSDNGWFVTTPEDSGERFYVDPGLQLGTLVIAANIAEQGYCEPTGSSVLYQLNYKSGNVLMTTEYSAQIVGITQLQTQGGTGPVVIDPVFADGNTGNANQVTLGGGSGSATRVSWREIE